MIPDVSSLVLRKGLSKPRCSWSSSIFNWLAFNPYWRTGDFGSHDNRKNRKTHGLTLSTCLAPDSSTHFLSLTSPYVIRHADVWIVRNFWCSNCLISALLVTLWSYLMIFAHHLEIIQLIHWDMHFVGPCLVQWGDPTFGVQPGPWRADEPWKIGLDSIRSV